MTDDILFSGEDRDGGTSPQSSKTDSPTHQGSSLGKGRQFVAVADTELLKDMVEMNPSVPGQNYGHVFVGVSAPRSAPHPILLRWVESKGVVRILVKAAFRSAWP